MSHRIAIYKIQVRHKRDTGGWKPFGDIDGAATWLGERIDKVLADLEVTSRDGKVEVRADEPLADLERTQVGWSVVSGRSGVASRIEKHGEKPFLRTPAHIEAMRSAVLFDLPRARTTGYLAGHVPHRHGCKASVEDALATALGAEDLKLDIRPVVPQDALLEAVRRNGLEQVTVIKHDPLGVDAFEDAAMSGDEEVGRLKLSIPTKRGRRLRGDPVLDFLEEPSDAKAPASGRVRGSALRRGIGHSRVARRCETDVLARAAGEQTPDDDGGAHPRSRHR